MTATPPARSGSAVEPVDLRTLTRRFAHAGRLEAILLRSARPAAAQLVSEARALAGRGLAEDRRACLRPRRRQAPAEIDPDRASGGGARVLIGGVLRIGDAVVCGSSAKMPAEWVRPLGLAKWKLAYSLASAIGLGLIVWGNGATPLDPLVLWAPAPWTWHLAAVLTLPAFVLIAAAYVPGTRLRATLGHAFRKPLPARFIAVAYPVTVPGSGYRSRIDTSRPP